MEGSREGGRAGGGREERARADEGGEGALPLVEQTEPSGTVAGAVTGSRTVAIPEPPGAVPEAEAATLEAAVRQAFLRGASPASAALLARFPATAAAAAAAPSPPAAPEELVVVVELACTFASSGKLRYARGFPV